LKISAGNDVVVILDGDDGYQNGLIAYLCGEHNKTTMEVISAREFRTNQTKYLGMVKEGKEVILKSRGLGSFRITPLTAQDVVTNELDLIERLRLALQEVKLMQEGKIETLSMAKLLDEL